LERVAESALVLQVVENPKHPGLIDLQIKQHESNILLKRMVSGLKSMFDVKLAAATSL